MIMKYPGNDPENGPAYDTEARDKYGNLMYDSHGNRIWRRKDGKPYWGPDWRKSKKWDNKATAGTGYDVMMAYYRGSEDAEFGRDYRNPYPPGRRHDEYHRSFTEHHSVVDKGYGRMM